MKESVFAGYLYTGEKDRFLKEALSRCRVRGKQKAGMYRDYRGVDFGEASFVSEVFTGSVFVGADLSKCQIEKSCFSSCYYDSTTKFPEGFAPKSHGMINLDEPVFVGESLVGKQGMRGY